MLKTTKKKLRPQLKFSDNLNYLLVAFAIAFVAWVFTKASESLEARLVVPVRLTGVDERVEARIAPDSMPVVVRYTSDMQGYINSDNFSFVVDISAVRDGLGVEWKTRSFALSGEFWVANVPRQRRIQLMQIGGQANTVEVRARWKARPAVIEPDIAGQSDLPQGLQLVTPVRVSPREVWVVGDAAALDALPIEPSTGRIRLGTQRVSIARRTQSAVERVPINLPQGVEIVQPRVEMAEVNLEIQEVVTVREIRTGPLVFEAVSSDTIHLSYDETSAVVTVRGPQSLLQKLDAASLEVRLVRPPEELPGTTKELQLEAVFARSVDETVREKVIIQGIMPKSLRIRYIEANDEATTEPTATVRQP